jgi:c-di-GMP-binding flagellar brake protein YcgR
MKKDIIFSMRMSTQVREALKTAAKREHRTISSLLSKIITEHLEKEGLSVKERPFEERRRHQRRRLLMPSKTYLDANSKAKDLPGVILDISLGGVLVTYPKASEIRTTSIGELSSFELCFELPSTREKLCFGCDARRMTDTGNEIQVGAIFRNPSDASLEKLQTSFA